jgi:hypothetical protein
VHPLLLKSYLRKILASHLRKIWDKKDRLFKSQHKFRPGNSCESQVIKVCQDTADSLDNRGGIDAIITDFSMGFHLVPQDRLLKKTAASGVGLRAVVWIGEFLLGRTHRVKVGGKLSEIDRVSSVVLQGSVLGPLLFLSYVMIFGGMLSQVLDFSQMTV